MNNKYILHITKNKMFRIIKNKNYYEEANASN